MANNGYLQAIIAFKVDAVTGEALDRNGDRTSETGLRQAIRLLQGSANPNPALYDVEAYFEMGGVIMGEATAVVDTTRCPTGVLIVSPSRVIMGTTESVNLDFKSTAAWTSINNSPAAMGATSGAGSEIDGNLTLTGQGVAGQGPIEFSQPSTGERTAIYVIVTDDPDLWILDGGEWHDIGFWFDSELWQD